MSSKRPNIFSPLRRSHRITSRRPSGIKNQQEDEMRVLVTKTNHLEIVVLLDMKAGQLLREVTWKQKQQSTIWIRDMQKIKRQSKVQIVGVSAADIYLAAATGRPLMTCLCTTMQNTTINLSEGGHQGGEPGGGHRGQGGHCTAQKNNQQFCHLLCARGRVPCCSNRHVPCCCGGPVPFHCSKMSFAM